MKNLKKRLIALLLFGILAAGMCLPAAAAAAPALGYTPPSGGAATLTVEDLPANTAVYAVQVTLELAGECTPSFTPADTAAYHTERTENVDGSTRLTVYLVNGQKPLNPSGPLTLGTLQLAEGETLTMPETAVLHLLGDDLAPLVGADGDTVPTRLRRPSGGGGGSSVPAVKPPAQEEPGAPLPYTDVKETDWFCEAARYVYEKGLMSGTTPTTFDPEKATTRGMIVTILYRLEGSPAADLPEFGDVPAQQYYARPIAWAARNGIVSGYPGGTFAPEQAVTREQLATILYRYAAYKQYDTAARADLGSYQDQSQVNGYAADALSWAGAVGLIQGVSAAALAPQGQATRAQTATILMRLCENIAKD